MVDTLDSVEDFDAITRFELPPGRGAEEWGIINPSWYTWQDGAVATTTLSNAVKAAILYADSNGDGSFTPGVDALWIDSNQSKTFNDLEPVIHGVLSDQDLPSGMNRNANFTDLNGNGIPDIGVELMWIDTLGAIPATFHS